MNDPPTSIEVAGATLKQNISGATIGELSATDQDTTQSHTFSVTDSRFEIVNSVLKLKTGQFVASATGGSIDIEIVATDSGSPPRQKTQLVTIQVQPNSFPWRQSGEPLDTSGDGAVAPIDALHIINLLNDPDILDPGGRLPISRAVDSDLPFYDVNGDGFAAPIDVVLVINFLNGEGEGEGQTPDQAFADKVYVGPIQLFGEVREFVASGGDINLLNPSRSATLQQSVPTLDFINPAAQWPADVDDIWRRLAETCSDSDEEEFDLESFDLGF